MALPMSLDTFVTDLSVRIGVSYTDEQREFLKDFTSSIISFSSPGTGKTKSAIGGLITAELYHQIPGKNIYALSFTNMSTGELQVRHKQECEKVGIRQTVNFQTLHSLCSRILKENYKLLGIGKLQVVSTIPIAEQADILTSFAQEHGINFHPWQVRPLINAVRSMNSSLVFDRVHVESKYAFKDQCRILLVDEFQDLSLLQLRIISLLSDTVIAIGDIKQQIYAFNGACQEIVQEFRRYFPNARELNLNHSFRCADSIVDFSKVIIHPNDMHEEDFIGTGRKGSVDVIPQLPLATICDKIEQDYRMNLNTFPRDILFLFRNNYSAIPIAEELYKRKVPFRVNKYQAANQIPVIKEMCSIVELAANPSNLNNLDALRYLLKEQKDYRNYSDTPIYKVCRQEGCSLFEAPYTFRDPRAARAVMEMLLTVRDMLDTQKPMRDILNTIYPIFNDVYLREREHLLEMQPSYYFIMVKPVVREKTYHKFIQDELAKVTVIQDSNARRVGVRCYTFHASKGLEADDVYIIDADANILPNLRKLDIMERAGCTMEKAREIRNERSLLFVAATRARDTLTITYTTHKTSMMTPLNEFVQYDRLYTQFQATYPDVEAFENFRPVRIEVLSKEELLNSVFRRA